MSFPKLDLNLEELYNLLKNLDLILYDEEGKKVFPMAIHGEWRSYD